MMTSKSDPRGHPGLKLCVHVSVMGYYRFINFHQNRRGSGIFLGDFTWNDPHTYLHGRSVTSWSVVSGLTGQRLQHSSLWCTPLRLIVDSRSLTGVFAAAAVLPTRLPLVVRIMTVS